MANHEAYLRSSLQKYQFADITKRDILNAIQSYPDLRPKLDTFVFNDGSRKELLCLEGTIPVSYQGSTYNIPVCIWLLDTHPNHPPLGFVKPTSTMQIKPGRHVDANGRVYLPYLHEWKHPKSDLLGLIQILVIIFGEEPPVFARGSAQARTPYPNQAQPGGLPYPASGSAMPMPSYPPSTAGYHAPTTAYPQQSPYPSYPAYPAQQPQPAGARYPGSYPSYQQPSYPAQQSFATNAGSGTSTSTSSNTNTLPLSEEQIKASLRSAVEDKMKRRLKEIFAQAQAEMDALKKTQEDLQSGKKRLDDMLDKLEKEQNEVERNIYLLREKDTEIEEVLQKMESREEVNMDDIIVPTAPLYRQLLNAFAEEQATEDAIYYLGESLRKGVIYLDVFLKQVREMSRKQFMLRALIQKCRQKAALPDLST